MTTLRLYYKLVGSGTGDVLTAQADADLVVDSDGTVVKDSQGLLADMAEQAWRYRDLSA